MGKNLMLYLAVRNGILIIVGIGYLYKIVKKEKLLPKIDDPPVEMGLRISTAGNINILYNSVWVGYS